jgi:hypothetical protein
MTKFVKLAALAATVFITTPALAAPVGVTGGPPPSATARIIKPLTLTSTGALDFGTIVMNGVTANRTIALSNLNAVDCASGSTEVVCSGTTSVPTYNVRGTNNQVVNIIKTASALTGSNGGSLTLTPTGAATVTLTSSGSPGNDFAIGGTIVIAPATIDGVYTGTVNVTVDY